MNNMEYNKEIRGQNDFKSYIQIYEKIKNLISTKKFASKFLNFLYIFIFFEIYIH